MYLAVHACFALFFILAPLPGGSVVTKDHPTSAVGTNAFEPSSAEESGPVEGKFFDFDFDVHFNVTKPKYVGNFRMEREDSNEAQIEYAADNEGQKGSPSYTRTVKGIQLGNAKSVFMSLEDRFLNFLIVNDTARGGTRFYAVEKSNTSGPSNTVDPPVGLLYYGLQRIVGVCIWNGTQNPARSPNADITYRSTSGYPEAKAYVWPVWTETQAAYTELAELFGGPKKDVLHSAVKNWKAERNHMFMTVKNSRKLKELLGGEEQSFDNLVALLDDSQEERSKKLKDSSSGIKESEALTSELLSLLAPVDEARGNVLQARKALKKMLPKHGLYPMLPCNPKIPFYKNRTGYCHVVLHNEEGTEVRFDID